MFAQRTTRQTYRYDLVENQFHSSTRLPTRRFLSTASSTFPTSRTISGPYYVCDVKYPILSAPRLLDTVEDMDLTSLHDTAPSHMDNNKHTS